MVLYVKTYFNNDTLEYNNKDLNLKKNELHFLSLSFI